MKKDYKKPLAEIIEFVPEDTIMDSIDVGDGPAVGGSGVGDDDDW